MQQTPRIGSTCIVLMACALSLTACQKQEVGNKQTNSEQSTLVMDSSKQNSKAAEFEFNNNQNKNNKAEQHSSSHTIKPRPPINVSYKILGTPQIGQPLEIELEVSSDIVNEPIQVKYRAMDDQALSFMPGANGEQSYKLSSAKSNGKRKVVVVPQREGRSYFTVSTEIETENGLVMNSTSIAIQVGNKPAKMKINGELKTDPSGESVISMPATQQ